METHWTDPRRVPGEEPRSVADVAIYAVRSAIWAPSVHNTQPWSFAADNDGLSLYADCGRQLTVADASGRELVISCGAALFTARLALRMLGHIPETQILPVPGDPLLIARLRWLRRAPPTEYERKLFSQVTARRTHRGGFDPLPLAPELLDVLQRDAARDGARLRIMPDDASRAVLAAAVQAGDEALRLNSDYVRELAAWVPRPGSMRRDGVPDTSYPRRPEHTDPDFPSRDFARGRGWGLPRFGSPAAYRSAGVVCLLTTTHDRPVDWVSSGQALQRLLLTSATCGVAAAIHSQPLETASLREQVRTQLCDGDYPQLVVRLGVVVQTAASVRRPPASVLSVCASDQQRAGRSRRHQGAR